MIRLKFQGVFYVSSRLRELKSRFKAEHCVRLPGFLAPEILSSIFRDLRGAASVKRSYGSAVGVELRQKEGRGWNLLHFLMNDPNLFRLIEEMTGISPARFFSGRIYRMNPGEGHYLAWHNDLSRHRVLALSVNLSRKPYYGGRLQIRSSKTEKILYEAGSSKAGDALLFRVDPGLEHRVTELTGKNPRFAYAGWFYPKSETGWFKKK